MRGAWGTFLGVGVLCLLLGVQGCGDSDDLPPGLVSVVFDIDGTLTQANLDIYSVRPHAAEIVWAYVNRGYSVIYLTGRMKALEPVLFHTDRYLAENGFPDCPLYESDLLPLITPHDVMVDYKVGVLQSLQATEDRTFFYGFGDSSSDFEAYADVGVPANNVFAMVPKPGETECKPGVYGACLEGYGEILPFVQDLPVANGGHAVGCN